jgi:hypothetical protein
MAAIFSPSKMPRSLVVLSGGQQEPLSYHKAIVDWFLPSFPFLPFSFSPSPSLRLNYFSTFSSVSVPRSCLISHGFLEVSSLSAWGAAGLDNLSIYSTQWAKPGAKAGRCGLHSCHSIKF